MVITVTLNPALDKTLTIDGLETGGVNRVTSVRHDIGGKGINVSKVLREFGVDSICTGFLGGILEDVFRKELEKRGIQADFVSVEGSTRTNIKIVDVMKNEYTDINEPGAVISREELEAFLRKFETLVKEGDIVVLSGGVSPSVPKDIYRRLTELSRARGAYVLVDAEGPLLEEALKAKPDVIKPNDRELSMLMGKEIGSDEEILDAARQLRMQGIGKVLVSLGGDGSLLVTEDGALRAKGLKVPVKSTVGAGDSMVAALVYAKLKGMTDKETLGFAQASGAATVMLEGTKACTLGQVENLLEESESKIMEVE